MAIELLPQQEQMLELLTSHREFLLLAEQGTMKTYPMLVHLTNLMLGGEIKDALVVADEAFQGAWFRDINGKLSGTRQRLARERIKFITYGVTSRATSKKRKALEHDWGAIVLDEGHAIASWKGSNRTKFFIGSLGRYPKSGLNSRTRYRYMMTGTLIGNGRLEDVWPAVEYVSPGYLGTKAEFKLRHLTTFRLPGSHVEIVDKKRYKRVDELMDRLAPICYRITKAECLDLPEKLPDEVITIPLHSDTVATYKQAEQAYIDSLDMVMDNPLVVMGKLRQVASGFVMGVDIEATRLAQSKNPKAKPVMKVIARFPCEKPKYLAQWIDGDAGKAVVWAHFKQSIRDIQAVCDKLGARHLTLDGDQKDKAGVWNEFQNDPDIKVFIGQYQSASKGIDLFAASRNLYYEPTDTSRDLEQSRDRTHRPGQHWPVSYDHFITAGTIEEQMRLSNVEGQDFTEARYRDIVRKRMVDSA